MKKSISSLIFAFVLLLTCSPAGASAAEAEVSFQDVKPTSWYYGAVDFVNRRGLMSGTETAIFSPDKATTRGMLVTILYRLEGEPYSAAASFTDVSANQWYAKAVSWACENNIVNGYGNGRFGPNDAVTREQAAAILYRYAQKRNYTCDAAASLDTFSDVLQVSSYAVSPMRWAVGTGIISGVGNNRLSPKKGATRAELAMILMRFCESVLYTNEPSFDRTFWNLAFGQTQGSLYAARFNGDGTMSVYHRGSGSYPRGTFTYEYSDGILLLYFDTTDIYPKIGYELYRYNGKDFVSVSKRRMMVGSDYYRITYAPESARLFQ